MSIRDEIDDFTAYRRASRPSWARVCLSIVCTCIWYIFVSSAFFGDFYHSHGRLKPGWLPTPPTRTELWPSVVFWSECCFCVLSSFLVFRFLVGSGSIFGRLRDLIVAGILAVGLSGLVGGVIAVGRALL